MKYFKSLLPLLIVTVLLALGLYSAVKNSAEAPVTTNSTGIPAKLVKETDAISVTVSYPQIPGAGREIEEANLFLQNEIQKQVVSFEKEAIDNMDSDPGLPQTVKSTIQGGGGVEEANARYASLFVSMEWYLRGAAHPFHTIETYIYDYQEKKFVTVDELFIPGSSYLEELSNYSYDDLLKQSQQGDLGFVYHEDLVKDGTKPIKENFSRVLPIKDGLMIYFGEYQVAPYAAGPQQVVVPYEKLKHVIKREGVLGMYLP